MRIGERVEHVQMGKGTIIGVLTNGKYIVELDIAGNTGRILRGISKRYLEKEKLAAPPSKQLVS